LAANLPRKSTVWSSPAEAPSDRYVPTLDGIRGLAILLVLAHHQTVMGGRTAADQLFLRFTDLGWCGVDLFFVLSGFLITGILADSKASPAYFRSFYARRILRIFPLYYLVVFISVVLLPRLPQLHGLLLSRPLPADPNAEFHWLYLSNFLFAAQKDFGHPTLGLAWSLAIEEQFYAVWPLLVWMLARPAMMRLCALLAVAALLLRGTMVALDTHPVPVYVLPFTRMDALAIGGLLALVARGDGGLPAISRQARWTGLAALAIVLILWAVDKNNDRWEHRAMQTIGYSALAVMFGSLLVRVLTANPSTFTSRAFRHPILRMFGRYSYALYLLHIPAQVFVERRWFQPSPPIPPMFGSEIPVQIAFFAAATAASLALAWASWHLVEKRFLALKRFFPVQGPGARCKAVDQPVGEFRQPD
jgi:peptidoglycan/LPS O-acetylase OafA/YrhL